MRYLALSLILAVVACSETSAEVAGFQLGMPRDEAVLLAAERGMEPECEPYGLNLPSSMAAEARKFDEWCTIGDTAQVYYLIFRGDSLHTVGTSIRWDSIHWDSLTNR